MDLLSVVLLCLASFLFGILVGVQIASWIESL